MANLAAPTLFDDNQDRGRQAVDAFNARSEGVHGSFAGEPVPVMCNVLAALVATGTFRGRRVTAYDLLRRAIAERKQVIAHYKGHRREFCPHVLGTTSRSPRVLAYQFGGAGSRGPIAAPEDGDWRCFDVDQLADVHLRDGAWHTGEARHVNRQRCVEIVDADVAFEIGTLAAGRRE